MKKSFHHQHNHQILRLRMKDCVMENFLEAAKTYRVYIKYCVSKNSRKFATSPSPALGCSWLYKKVPANLSDCTLALRWELLQVCYSDVDEGGVLPEHPVIKCNKSNKTRQSSGTMLQVSQDGDVRVWVSEEQCCFDATKWYKCVNFGRHKQISNS